MLIEVSISHSVGRYLSRGYLHNVALEHSGKAQSESWLPSMEAMERQTFSTDNLKHLVWAPAQNWPPEKSISVVLPGWKGWPSLQIHLAEELLVSLLLSLLFAICS